MLDDALDRLSETDRQAVLLRFFEGKSFAEIGGRLRLAENTARMRVDRAVEKMRARLARRGVASTAAALGVAFASQAGVAAPAGLAASVKGAALAGAATGGAGAWLAFLTMSKIKVGIASAMVVAVVATGVVELRANRELRAELGAVQTANGSIDQLRAESQQLSIALTKLDASNPEADELARLRERAARLKARPPWVVESRMRKVVAARNAGWATDVAALETFVWARATGDWQALADNFAWVGEAKGKADAAFARLSEAVRAKFGSADRLAGTVIFRSGARGYVDPRWTRTGALETGPTLGDDRVVGYWAEVDPDARYPRPGTFLRIRSWAQLMSGQERPVITDLCYAGGSWTVGTSMFSDEVWQNLVAQIDPATGEPLRPKK